MYCIGVVHLQFFDDGSLSFCDSAQAHSLDEVILGRFLVGLGIGVNTVLVPIYISEVWVVFAYFVHANFQYNNAM